MAHPFQPRRASGVRDLVDPAVPFPGGHDDRVTIELPCMRIVEEVEESQWTDICLSLRGGEQMAVVELPTRFEDFRTIPSSLWQEFWAETESGRLGPLMNPDQRWGVQRLLDVFAYLADHHDVAEQVWDSFVEHLDMAAIVSSTQRGPEHADWFVYGLGLWASTQWPDVFPPPPRGDEDDALEFGGGDNPGVEASKPDQTAQIGS